MRLHLSMAVMIGLAAIMPASAQQPPAAAPPGGYAQFRQFFTPLIGTWPVHILDRDAAGKTEYETVQLRDFRFTIGGAFVRETAIVRDAMGRQVEAGLQLHGFAPGGQILIHGFWGNSVDRFVFVSGRLEGTGRETRLAGTMTVTHPDGRKVESRSEMRWETPERFVWRTFSKRPDGSTYTDEQLTYTVAPVEVLGGRPG